MEYYQTNNQLQEIAWILNDSSRREIDRGHFLLKTVHDHTRSVNGYFDFYTIKLLKTLNQKYTPLWVAYERIDNWGTLFFKNDVINHPTIKSVKTIAKEKLNDSFSLVQLYQHLLKKEFPPKINSLNKVEAVKDIYYRLIDPSLKRSLFEKVIGIMSSNKQKKDMTQTFNAPSSSQIHNKNTSTSNKQILQPQNTGCLTGFAEFINDIFHFLSMLFGAIIIAAVFVALYNGLVEIITRIMKSITGS